MPHDSGNDGRPRRRARRIVAWSRVLPLEKSSQQVWQALRADRPIPESAMDGSVGDKGNSPVTAGS